MSRGLILALGFLTRIPMPALPGFEPVELRRAAPWFPVVGLLIGALLALIAQLGDNPWLAALLALLCWVAVTGGLHLDGAADLADALGAAHGDPDRFHAVLKDPHTGSFGVIAIALVLIAKLIGLAALLPLEGGIWALLLAPAWARFGAMLWSHNLPAIAPGSGERFGWELEGRWLWIYGLGLLLLSWIVASLLFGVACFALLLLWQGWLKWRLSGMTGDCLGAGIEYAECGMLIAAALLL